MAGLTPLLRGLCPPLVVEAYRRLRYGTPSCFEGIYRDTKELPRASEIFDSGEWVKHELTTLQWLRAESTATTAPRLPQDAGALAWTLAWLSQGSDSRIVDFGGGIGLMYERLRRQYLGGGRLFYHIVEKEGVCHAGRQAFGSDADLQFHSDIPSPEMLGTVDVVYIATALQYVEDPARLIERLAGLRPRAFVLARVSAGDIPTHLTVQQYLGHRSPYRFLNLESLLAWFDALGYQLRLKSPGESIRYPSSYPASHRIPFTLDLLLCAKT